MLDDQYLNLLSLSSLVSALSWNVLISLDFGRCFIVECLDLVLS